MVGFPYWERPIKKAGGTARGSDSGRGQGGGGGKNGGARHPTEGEEGGNNQDLSTSLMDRGSVPPLSKEKKGINRQWEVPRRTGALFRGNLTTTEKRENESDSTKGKWGPCPGKGKGWIKWTARGDSPCTEGGAKRAKVQVCYSAQ